MYFRLIIFFSNRQLSYNVHYYQHKPTEYFEVTGKNKKVYFHRINEQWYYRSGEIPPYLFTSFTRALATTLKQKIDCEKHC